MMTISDELAFEVVERNVSASWERRIQQIGVFIQSKLLFNVDFYVHMYIYSKLVDVIIIFSSNPMYYVNYNNNNNLL